MKDRIPTYPGRVKITHADGSSELATVERADEPVDEGTPLNKSTLLKDDTATALGLDPAGNPTVDDAFSATTKRMDINARAGELLVSARDLEGEFPDNFIKTKNNGNKDITRPEIIKKLSKFVPNKDIGTSIYTNNKEYAYKSAIKLHDFPSGYRPTVRSFVYKDIIVYFIWDVGNNTGFYTIQSNGGQWKFTATTQSAWLVGHFENYIILQSTTSSIYANLIIYTFDNEGTVSEYWNSGNVICNKKQFYFKGWFPSKKQIFIANGINDSDAALYLLNYENKNIKSITGNNNLVYSYFREVNGSYVGLNNNGVIWYSDDFASFSQITLRFNTNDGSRRSMYLAVGEDYENTDPNAVILAGKEGAVWISIDKGHSFSKYYINTTQNEDSNYVYFLDKIGDYWYAQCGDYRNYIYRCLQDDHGLPRKNDWEQITSLRGRSLNYAYGYIRPRKYGELYAFPISASENRVAWFLVNPKTNEIRRVDVMQSNMFAGAYVGTISDHSSLIAFNTSGKSYSNFETLGKIGDEGANLNDYSTGLYDFVNAISNNISNVEVTLLRILPDVNKPPIVKFKDGSYGVPLIYTESSSYFLIGKIYSHCPVLVIPVYNQDWNSSGNISINWYTSNFNTYLCIDDTIKEKSE